MSIEDNKKRYSLNPLQVSAIMGATKLSELTKTHIDTQNKKISELLDCIKQAEKQIQLFQMEIDEVKSNLHSHEVAAKEQYSATLELVVSELKTPSPPWKAVVIYEKGLPIAIELLKDS